MAPRTDLNYERMAMAVVESIWFDHDAVAKRYGIATRTLKRWRQWSTERGELQRLVDEKKERWMMIWIEEATNTLNAALIKLRELISRDAQPSQIHAVAGAIKIVGELTIAHDALKEDVDDIDSADSQAGAAAAED